MELVTKITFDIPLWALLCLVGSFALALGKLHMDNALLKKDMESLTKELKDIKELLYNKLRPDND